MKIKLVTVILFLFISTQLFSNEKVNKINPILVVGVLEGAIVLNSLMASVAPKAYGLVTAALFPFSVTVTNTGVKYWVNLAIIESLSVYNLCLNENKYEEKEIFINNIIGWHLIIGALSVTEYLFNNKKKDEKMNISVRPTNVGMQLSFEYKY